MSMIHIAHANQYGKGVDQDFHIAESWYRRAANAGSIDASFRLGVLYSNERRFAEAIEAFEVGDRNEYPPAIFRLGRMFMNGFGVEANPSKATLLWERAASLGHLYARRNIAILRLKGRYGMVGFIQGIGMWLSVIWDAIFLLRRNPDSDLAR